MHFLNSYFKIITVVSNETDWLRNKIMNQAMGDCFSRSTFYGAILGLGILLLVIITVQLAAYINRRCKKNRTETWKNINKFITSRASYKNFYFNYNNSTVLTLQKCHIYLKINSLVTYEVFLIRSTFIFFAPKSCEHVADQILLFSLIKKKKEKTSIIAFLIHNSLRRNIVMCNYSVSIYYFTLTTFETLHPCKLITKKKTSQIKI